MALLGEDHVSNLEVEWQSGSVWLEGTLLGSADLPVPPGTDMRGVRVREDLDSKPWVSAKLIASDLKKLREKDVRKAFDDSKR